MRTTLIWGSVLALLMVALSGCANQLENELPEENETDNTNITEDNSTDADVPSPLPRQPETVNQGPITSEDFLNYVIVGLRNGSLPTAAAMSAASLPAPAQYNITSANLEGALSIDTVNGQIILGRLNQVGEGFDRFYHGEQIFCAPAQGVTVCSAGEITLYQDTPGNLVACTEEGTIIDCEALGNIWTGDVPAAFQRTVNVETEDLNNTIVVTRDLGAMKLVRRQ